MVYKNRQNSLIPVIGNGFWLQLTEITQVNGNASFGRKHLSKTILDSKSKIQQKYPIKSSHFYPQRGLVNRKTLDIPLNVKWTENSVSKTCIRRRHRHIGHVIHSFNDRSVGSCLFDSHELKFACSQTLASDSPKHWKWYQRQFPADELRVENCSERCFVHYFDQKRTWYDDLEHLHQKARLSQIPWLNG